MNSPCAVSIICLDDLPLLELVQDAQDVVGVGAGGVVGVGGQGVVEVGLAEFSYNICCC